LNEINSGKSNLNEKDITIATLENEIKSNHYDNEVILAEVKILFPEINNLSITNHKFYENTDSLKVYPVLVYQSKTNLSNLSKEKLSLWLKKRLTKDKIEIYRLE
jgi:hypothetical protein